MGNISNGFKCLFGTNSYNTKVHDTCNGITFKYPIIHFLLFVTFIIINRLSLHQLLKNKTYLQCITNKNSFIQHLTSTSIIISFLFCYLEQVQNLWNNVGNNGMYKIHLKMDWEIPIITILLSI